MSCLIKKPILGFRTRSNSNWAVQPEKIARCLKFRIKKVERLFYLKTKALISCTISGQLILTLVFAYANDNGAAYFVLALLVFHKNVSYG